MDEYPGITFRDGPTGFRAALINGPDVWEVVATLSTGAARGDEAVSATADLLSLNESEVRTALRYYGSFGDEIHKRIALNSTDPDEAEAIWKREQAK